MKKLPNIIFGLLFLSFAYVNINDPDPWLWVAIYLIVALVFLFKAFGYYSSKVTLAISVSLVLYSLMYAPYFWEWLTTPNKSELFGQMVYLKPYIEGTREFGGLVIAAVSLLYSLKTPEK